jgi:hypothetical protein
MNNFHSMPTCGRVIKISSSLYLDVLITYRNLSWFRNKGSKLGIHLLIQVKL